MKTIVIGILVLFVLFLMMRGRTSGMVTRTPGPKKAPHAPWTLGPTRAPRTPGPTKSVFQKVVSILKPTMAPVKKK